MAFQKVTRSFIASVLSGVMVLAALLPALSIASPFSTDSSLNVYPSNDTLTFEGVRAGETITRYFVVENSDTVSKFVDVVTEPAAPFSYDGASRVNIPAGEEVLLPVTFAPTSSGDVASRFTIKAHTGETKTLQVRGRSTGATTDSGFTVTPSSVIFPDTVVGFRAEATVSFKNNNTFPVTFSVTDTGDVPFQLLSGHVMVVEPGRTERAVIEFFPTAKKSYDTQIKWSTTDPERRAVTVNVEGKGSEVVIPTVAEVAFEPTVEVIDFGTISTDDEAMKQIRVINTGNADLSATIVEDAYTPFEADLGNSGRTELSLGEDNEGKLRVTFKPLVPGTFTSHITLHTNAINAPVKRFVVRGTAVAGFEPAYTFKINDSLSDTRLTDSDSATISYSVNLPGSAEITVVRDGVVFKTLRTRAEGQLIPNKTYKEIWDGTDNFGNPVADGIYSYIIRAYSDVDNQTAKSIKNIEVDIHRNSDTPRFNPRNVVVLSSDTVNPDINQMAYFNFYLNEKTDVTYTIKNQRTGQTVISKRLYNLKKGDHSWEVYWDGRSSSGNKVEQGNYTYEFVIGDATCAARNYCRTPEVYTGKVFVNRSSSHLSEPIVTRVGSYDSYFTNDNLVTKLDTNTERMTRSTDELTVSFETLHDGTVSAWVLDSQDYVVKQLASSLRLRDGFHYNQFSWDGTINGRVAADGRYKVKVTVDQIGETDTDFSYFTIDRGYNYSNPTTYRLTDDERTVVNYHPERPSDYYETSYNCGIFIDVDGSLCDAVGFAYNNGIFEGSYVNGVRYMRPDDYLTRTEATAIVLRVMDINLQSYNEYTDGNLGFKDVDTNAWYMPYVKTIIKSAVNPNSQYGNWFRNIMQGYPDGTVRPNQTMSRAEFYKVFVEASLASDNVRANFSLNRNVTSAPFSDTKVDQVTAWYLPYAEWAQKELTNTPFAAKYFDKSDLSSGVRYFKPAKGITRGEVMELIYATDMLNVINY